MASQAAPWRSLPEAQSRCRARAKQARSHVEAEPAVGGEELEDPREPLRADPLHDREPRTEAGERGEQARPGSRRPSVTRTRWRTRPSSRKDSTICRYS